MNIKLYSNKDIRDEGALQVTSSNYFKNNIPDPDGLFSPIIFGATPDEKLRKVGFIDIGRKLLHPLVYIRIFERSFRKIDSLIKGDETFSVVGGKLVSDPNGKTGMDFFISVMDQLDLFNGVEKDEDSLISAKLKTAMKNMNKEEILVSNWLVTPLGYRDVSTLDVDLSAIDESNNLYRDLIRLSDYYQQAKNQPLVNVNSIIYRMQMKINGIFNYFEGMTFKKFGIQNKLVLARNIDYSSRLIISAINFDMNNYNTHWSKWDIAGVPLSAIATNGILFALHHSDKVIEDLYNNGGFEHNGKSIPLESLKRDYFNKEVIAEMIDKYYGSWGERLEYINIPETDQPIMYKFTKDGKEITKPLTLLEFVYMLVYVPIELGKKCVMCRRYPIQGAFSIISLKTHVSSIDNVHKITFMGQEFPYFPNSVDAEKELHDSKNKSLSPKERAFKAGHLTTKFLETLLLSNLLMKGYNMDFDGDKLAVSLLMTEEANQEALAFLEDPQAIFTLGGYNYRKVLNKESISGLYGLTLENDKAKAIPDALAKELIEGQDFKKMSEYIFDKFVDGKIKSSPYKIESPCNFEYNNKVYKTTLGRALFNYTLCARVDAPYMNMSLTKKEQEQLLNYVDDICMKALAKEDLDYFKNTYIPFLNKWEEFVFVCSDLFSPSIDMDIYATSSEYDKFRDKLLSDNKEAIDKGDLEVYDMIEKELTKKLKETNKANTDIFDSGSKLSFGRDVRMGLIAVGPMPIGVGAGKYAISTRALLEGTTKEERATYAQSNIISGYFRAMGPAVGGEQAKEILAASHDIKLDAKGTDCGRTVGQWYQINDYFVKELDMRYMIKKDGSLEMLTSKSLKENYFGKKIQVRSVHFCKNVKYCNICSGEKPYIIARGDTINIGAQTSIAGDEITQASLSKFHQNKTQFKNVDFNDFITPAHFGIAESMNYSIKETLLNIQEMNSILIQEGNEVLAEEIADDIDDIMDDIFLKNPEEFRELIDSNLEMDIHKLSISKEELSDNLNYLSRRSGIIIKEILQRFGGTILCAADKLHILDVANFIYCANIDYILQQAANATDTTMPYLSSVNDDEEYKYYKMYLPVFSVNYLDAIKCGFHPEQIKETFNTIIEDLNLMFKGTDETVWEFSFAEDIDEENVLILLSPTGLILDTQFINIENTSEDDINIEEGVILDAATKKKMDSKIKSSKEHIRRKFEAAINQAIVNAGRQKKKAKESINETIEHKATTWEQDMRHSKDEYRKELSKMLQQFELNFIKKNKFKMFKLRNKLNFIYNKKSADIDNQMNEAIKALKHKMYSKAKEAEDKVKSKFGVS